MVEQFIITKRDMKFQVVYNPPNVTITPVQYGSCTQKTCELIARSYQIMTQFILSVNPMRGGERDHLISFFERKAFEIKMN